MAVNINPTPQSGQGAFGMVPGALSLPNPAGDLAAQLPGLPGLNATASQDLQSKLGGTLSPGTMNALKNAAATMGVSSGMPGSQLSWNSLYGNIAGASEAQQQQGLQDYSSLIPTVSGTQTVSPALQSQIAGTNASNAAAPNPTASASYAEQLFNQYLQQAKGPGGGTVNLPSSAFMSGLTPQKTTTASTLTGGYGDGGYGGSDVLNLPNQTDIYKSAVDYNPLSLMDFGKGMLA